ncbi:hypothetical protein SASPL_143881 [Salvia splendens]|uniref:Uncharacterized protein n=1 Tax=Salvia splendens TaxID=180675 RepID=A0A8X8WPR4_SALSN|nr:hypothetical protein SASPL_143881 [Salvia splendens]
MGEGEDDAEKGATTPLEMKGKGGARAASFVYGLAALENMGFVANMMSLVLYFMFKLYFDLPTAANTFTNLMGTTFLLSVVGGFISDTFINRVELHRGRQGRLLLHDNVLASVGSGWTAGGLSRPSGLTSSMRTTTRKPSRWQAISTGCC